MSLAHLDLKVNLVNADNLDHVVFLEKMVVLVQRVSWVTVVQWVWADHPVETAIKARLDQLVFPVLGDSLDVPASKVLVESPVRTDHQETMVDQVQSVLLDHKDALDKLASLVKREVVVTMGRTV